MVGYLDMDNGIVQFSICILEKQIHAKHIISHIIKSQGPLIDIVLGKIGHPDHRMLLLKENPLLLHQVIEIH